MLGSSARTKNDECSNRVLGPNTFASSIIKTNWDALNNPNVKEVSKTDNGVCYLMDNGDKIERIGGSIAWRNNNPGCIRYGNRSINMGAIGKANGFAIFPDEETGMNAIKSLLSSDAYRNLSITSAIYKYAPPHENNTERYINLLCGVAHVSRNTKLCDLDDKQLTNVVCTIRTIEGWIVGQELKTLVIQPKRYDKKTSHAMDNTRFHMVQKTFEKSI